MPVELTANVRQDVDYFVPTKTGTRSRFLLTAVSGCIRRRSITALVSH